MENQTTQSTVETTVPAAVPTEGYLTRAWEFTKRNKWRIVGAVAVVAVVVAACSGKEIVTGDNGGSAE